MSQFVMHVAPYRQPSDKRKVRNIPIGIKYTRIPSARVPSDWDGLCAAAHRLVTTKACAVALTDETGMLLAAVTLRDGRVYQYATPPHTFAVDADGVLTERRRTKRYRAPAEIGVQVRGIKPHARLIVAWDTPMSPLGIKWCSHRAEAIRFCLEELPTDADATLYDASAMRTLFPACRFHQGAFTVGKRGRQLPAAHPINFLLEVAESRVPITAPHKVVPQDGGAAVEVYPTFAEAYIVAVAHADDFGETVQLVAHSPRCVEHTATVYPPEGDGAVTAEIARAFLLPVLPPTPFEFPQGYILVPSLWNDGALAMPGLKRDKRQAEPTEIQHSLESLLVCAKKYGRRGCDVAPLIEAARVFINNGHEVPEKHRAFAEKKGLLAP